MPVLVLNLCPSAPSSFIFTRLNSLKAYICADVALMQLPMMHPPKPCSTFCSMSVKVYISLGNTCVKYISGVSTIYAS